MELYHMIESVSSPI